MASKSMIAQDVAKARKNTEESVIIIAKKLGLDIPNFEVHKRYSTDYRNAKKDLAVSEFFVQIAAAVTTKRRRKAKAK